MAYSCSDFVDSIVDQLKVTIPLEAADAPDQQAGICCTEIQRMQRFEKETRYALLVLSDATREDWIAAQARFIARMKNIAETNV